VAKTYATILDDTESLVQDGSNTIFTTAELDVLMPAGLVRMSQAKPWQYKLTKTTTADSRDVTLTASDKWRLLGVEKLEYLVDQNPPVYRGFTRFGDVVTIGVNSRPSSAVSIYFFLNKVHLLQKTVGTTDLLGAIKTLGAVGDVSLALKSLGTGTIDEMTTLAIAGDSTTYYVTAQATITGNEATVSIWPPLAAAAAVDAVVTLSLTASTLDMVLEDLLARWLASKASISKATKYYAQVDTAITTIANAATAIAAIAARITQAVADAASGRTALALGVTAITEADTEFDKIVTAIDLQKTAVASALALANTIPVGGGLNDFLAAANGDGAEAQARMLNGQALLQKASADNANAAQYLNAGAVELRGAGEKANEAIANLRLVATRLQVSQGGLRYEEWGRRELAKVEQELHALGGHRYSVRYARS